MQWCNETKCIINDKYWSYTSIWFLWWLISHMTKCSRGGLFDWDHAPAILFVLDVVWWRHQKWLDDVINMERSQSLRRLASRHPATHGRKFSLAVDPDFSPGTRARGIRNSLRRASITPSLKQLHQALIREVGFDIRMILFRGLIQIWVIIQREIIPISA